MPTLTIERQQNDIIRRVLNTRNSDLLKRFSHFITTEEEKFSPISQTIPADTEKQEILRDIKDGFNDLKLYQEGKVEFIDWEEAFK